MSYNLKTFIGRKRMIRWIALASVLALVPACAQEEGKYFNSYKGKTPPELVTDKENWLNPAGDDGIKLEKLKGKVVWLEFSFIN